MVAQLTFKSIFLFLLTLQGIGNCYCQGLPVDSVYAYNILKTQEDHLLQLLKGDAFAIEQRDSIFNVSFSKLLKQYSQHTFRYDFSNLIKHDLLSTYMSSDSLFKVYCWERLYNGSMRYYYIVYQYQGADGNVYTSFAREDEHENRAAVDMISTLIKVDIQDKPHYFVVKNTILSANDIVQSIECFRIDGQQLIMKVPVFKTSRKTFGSISFNFLRSSLYHDENIIDRNPYKLIEYDRIKNQIKIPVVNQQQQIKTSYLVYQMKGKSFEYIGVFK